MCFLKLMNNSDISDGKSQKLSHTVAVLPEPRSGLSYLPLLLLVVSSLIWCPCNYLICFWPGPVSIDHLTPLTCELLSLPGGVKVMESLGQPRHHEANIVRHQTLARPLEQSSSKKSLFFLTELSTLAALTNLTISWTSSATLLSFPVPPSSYCSDSVP